MSGNTVYIPQIDGKDLWIANYGNPQAQGYCLEGKEQTFYAKRYGAALDYSLDLIKLREVYKKVFRNQQFSFKVGKKEYSHMVINVPFAYSVKSWNHTAKNTYTKLGESLDALVWEDCLGYQNGALVAVKVNTPVVYPAEIGPHFYYQDGVYHVRTNIPHVATLSQIRQKLYQDGFVCNGMEYVRWKRSSGSARVGRCLFIAKPLYARMRKWELCGLKIGAKEILDLAALESYISLTSSSILDTLSIGPENILVIEDFESIFVDKDVVHVTDAQGRLHAKREPTQIANNIWDGQSLIDPSLMGFYRDKGMVLLRNRFFKSCCFNTNIQKWFSDYQITEVAQLNGFTLAQNVKDIQFITTPSSIKYTKFSNLQKWLATLEKDFGVVKFEKPPPFLNGTLVQTHYQLLNTLQLSKEDVSSFLAPTFSLLDLLKSDPVVFAHWIGFQEPDSIEMTALKSKADVIYKLLSIHPDFCKTKLYYDFRGDFLKFFVKNLKCGHVLINGNYSVLCGNPIEMLCQAIGTFHGCSPQLQGQIHCTRFENGRTIVGSRSPHITMSNVLLAQNCLSPKISRYLNATNEIVYINSIGENILQRLAGCDFDSDAVLLTDDAILVAAAQKNHALFPVAVSDLQNKKIQRTHSWAQLSDLDIKTSRNLIGDIVNDSQCLNSRIWDLCGQQVDYEKIEDIYLDVCKLSVMSGIEIDMAKKEFCVDTAAELSLLRKKHQLLEDGKAIKPYFFAHIAKQKGFYLPNKKIYKKHATTMDYLQQAVNGYRLSRKGKCTENCFYKFSDMIVKDNYRPKGVNKRQLAWVLEAAATLQEKIKALYASDFLEKQEQYRQAQELTQNFIMEINQIRFNSNTAIALLLCIEQEEYKRYRRLLFYALFGYPNAIFYHLLLKSKQPLTHLQEAPNGEITIFTTRYEKHTKTGTF